MGIGAGVAGTSAGVGLSVGEGIGAGVGAMVGGGATVMLTASVSVNAALELKPTPVTVASIGPSGTSDPSLVGPTKYTTSPGHRSAIGMEEGEPPMGAGSVNTISMKHSPLESGTLIS